MRFSHELIVPEEGLPFKLFLFEGWNGNYFREKHWHRSVEIFAVCQGELGFFVDDRMWRLTADEFIIVNSNEVHSIDAPRPNETIVLQIPLKMFEEYFTEEQFIWFTHEPGKKDERFMELIKELFRVYTEKQIGYNLKVKSIFYNPCKRVPADTDRSGFGKEEQKPEPAVVHYFLYEGKLCRRDDA